jgi:DNA-binding response OmpR family regulator
VPKILPVSQRVLIADDDPVIRHLVTSIIKKEGFIPVVVNDGGAAYRILMADADFSAGIFDMMMPNLQGLDLIRYMRTEKRLMRIPVMMISAELDLRLVQSSFEAGITMFLAKPFTTEKLQSSLRILLSSSHVGAATQPRRSIA